MIGFSLSVHLMFSEPPTFPSCCLTLARLGSKRVCRPLGHCARRLLLLDWRPLPLGPCADCVSTLSEVFEVVEPPELELELCASAVCTYCLAFLFFFFFHRMDPAPRKQRQKLESDRPPLLCPVAKVHHRAIALLQRGRRSVCVCVALGHLSTRCFGDS